MTGCSICGLTLHDDEPDHCVEHRVDDTPPVPGPLYGTWRHLDTRAITDYAAYLAELQVDEAVAGAITAATDLGLDPDAATAYVLDVRTRALQRARRDARIAVEHAEACRKHDRAQTRRRFAALQRAIREAA